MTKTFLRPLLLAGAAAALVGCGSGGLLHNPSPGTPSASATARLEPTRGNSVSGLVRFMQMGDVVKVGGEVRGLKPNSEHGFHVHEKGDCSSGDGNSAGGHFNPTGQAHGEHGHGAHHTGDLPSLRANAAGVATIDFTSTSIRVGGIDIVGRGLIVHADPDDYRTQPTGNSGARLACAVITAD
ncbi:superoxide dismutase, Cu-Zn family [Oryzisolibacter propanilivorax]|uniref:Superoxide dismutase [Cu-Zn] n=1 Tax=Oryzisolibacter propanilivorax TaxID=1527607 RepID=A0A1G9PKS8_9BURK|nr:superoxide dismutase family protein [Oryzisolibacter propanilivorax]SDL99163.1 superoxide dismutase, Cu-Zn family [Oryzisolibacter propanilivorax]